MTDELNSKISSIETWVKDQLMNETTGHDWYHIKRVTNLSKELLKSEAADEFIVMASALLHDIPDEKLVEDVDASMKDIENFLVSIDVDQSVIQEIFTIISTISFKGGYGDKLTSIEACIVQDADRLDAIGAIGIARTFQYGGAKGQAMYDPELAVRDDMSAKEYRQGNSTSVNHFYEKLLLLKDKLNTKRAKEIAEERENFMKLFLDHFFKEWNGEF